MLSFMREQRYEDLSEPKGAGAGSGPVEGGAEAHEQKYLTVAGQGKSVRRSTYMLAVVFGAGLLCLFFMIKKSAPKAASAGSVVQEAQIETAIQNLTGVKSEMYGRMDEIVNKFYEFSDVQQVNVTELSKNPFRNDMFGDSKGIADTENDVAPDAESIRRQRLGKQAKDLRLLSIMQSKQGNCCMIDDKILNEGDSIKDFTVAKIGADFVKLVSNGIEIILKLAE